MARKSSKVEWRDQFSIYLDKQELAMASEVQARFLIRGGISGTLRYALMHLHLCPAANTASQISLASEAKIKLTSIGESASQIKPDSIIEEALDQAYSQPQRVQVIGTITDILKLADGINENSELSTEDDDVGLDEIKLSKLNLPAASEAANAVPSGEQTPSENISANDDQPIDKCSP